MDIEMFGKLSDAFGPSGFEEDVIRTIADYCKEFDVENDAMNNLYVRMPGTEQDSRPVIQMCIRDRNLTADFTELPEYTWQSIRLPTG